MTRRVFVLFAGAALFNTSVNAQTPDAQCPAITSSQRISQDACQKAIDLFRYLAPQLGTSIAGGNATLGQGGNLGGLGHFSAGLRINAVQGSIPQIQNVTVSVTGETSTRFDLKTQVIPMPTADLAIGIFKGLPLAITNV